MALIPGLCVIGKVNKVANVFIYDFLFAMSDRPQLTGTCLSQIQEYKVLFVSFNELKNFGFRCVDHTVWSTKL